MGHFPNGALFLMDSGIPAFKTKSGILKLKQNSRSETNRNGFMILTFRFGHQSGVELGIDGSNLVRVGTEHDIIFSNNRKFTIGGANGQCEFNGYIGEILLYRKELDNSLINKVNAYLLEKWNDEIKVSIKDDKFEFKSYQNEIDQIVGRSDVLCYDGDYDMEDNDPKTPKSIISWNPKADTKTTTMGQRKAWARIIQAARKALGKYHGKRNEIQELEIRLSKERENIFGPPCSTIMKQSNRLQPLSNPKQDNKQQKQTSTTNCPQREFTNAILDWKPPKSANKENRDRWSDQVEKVKKEIGAFQFGGAKLHEFLRKHVRDMNNLRDKMFANDCDEILPIIEDNSSKTDCKAESGILDWKPPENADALALESWNDAIRKAKASIAGFDKGGEPLRQFLRSLVRNLEDKQRKIFAKICNF